MKAPGFADGLLAFVFRGVVPDYGNTLQMSLHESDPGASNDQATGETAYPGYARVDVVRGTGAGSFSVSGGQAVNTVTATFPVSTGGPVTISHWGVGVSGVLLYSFPLRDGAGVATTAVVSLATGGEGLATGGAQISHAPAGAIGGAYRRYVPPTIYVPPYEALRLAAGGQGLASGTAALTVSQSVEAGGAGIADAGAKMATRQNYSAVDNAFWLLAA